MAASEVRKSKRLAARAQANTTTQEPMIKKKTKVDKSAARKMKAKRSKMYAARGLLFYLTIAELN